MTDRTEASSIGENDEYGTARSSFSSLRPASIHSQYPSWIGPKHANIAEDVEAKSEKYPITVTFRVPDLQPPVFICTSMSDPEWQPIEMDYEQDADGFRFSKAFLVGQGEYQYKFRLGPGDWWICNTDQPTVHDDDGNENNYLIIDDSYKLDALVDDHDAPLLPHESVTLLGHEESQRLKKRSRTSSMRVERSIDIDMNDEADEDTDTEQDMGEPMSPLFRHESITLADYQEHQEHRQSIDTIATSDFAASTISDLSPTPSASLPTLVEYDSEPDSSIDEYQDQDEDELEVQALRVEEMPNTAVEEEDFGPELGLPKGRLSIVPSREDDSLIRKGAAQNADTKDSASQPKAYAEILRRFRSYSQGRMG